MERQSRPHPQVTEAAEPTSAGWDGLPPPVSHRGFEFLILSQLHRLGLAGTSELPLKVPLGLTATSWEPGVQARSTLPASDTFRDIPDDTRGKDQWSGQGGGLPGA